MKENNINKQIPSKEERFQQEQVELLKSCGNGADCAYAKASVYTVLLHLIQVTDLEEVLMILHNVAFDLGKREELEDLFERAKTYEW